jgi:hypothetical protein
MKYLAWLGTVSSICGSFLVAFGIMNFGYCAFLLGSFLWLIVAFMRNDRALLTLNGTFFLANIIGIFRYTLG